MENTNFEINGNSYHALTAGQKSNPLMLFLHGFPEYSGAWAGIIDAFADTHFCVAPDQRGYGKSWRPNGVEHYFTKFLVADVIEMIAQFGDGHVDVLVGHDWGASVAYATAISRSDSVSKLVILNGVHPVPFQRELAKGERQAAASEYINWMRRDGSEGVLAADDFAKMFTMFSAKMDMSWRTPEIVAKMKEAWRDAAGLGAMIDWYRASPLVVAPEGVPLAVGVLPDWDAEKLRIRMPHLLIWGMKDTALLPESRDGLEQLCDDLSVVEVRDADHWIVHQRPARVVQEIKGWLASH